MLARGLRCKPRFLFSEYNENQETIHPGRHHFGYSAALFLQQNQQVPGQLFIQDQRNCDYGKSLRKRCH